MLAPVAKSAPIPQRARRARRAAWVIAALLLAVASMVTAFTVAERAGVNALAQTAAQRLEIYRGSLSGELARYDYLSSVLGLNDDLVALLTTQDDGRVARINSYLETVSRDAKASDIYVMDLTGRTVAASNWNRQDSFVGMNFNFRPYFLDALHGGRGRFYGVGTVSNEPGYYFASGVYASTPEGRRMVGVATVKVSLHSFDNDLRNSGEIAVCVDENGVVFLSSWPELKFKTLSPVSREALARLNATRQYHTLRRFDPLGTIEGRLPFDDAGTLRFAPDPARTRSTSARLLADHYVIHQREVPGTPWKLVMLSALGPVRAAAFNAAAATGLAALAMFALALYAVQRRKATLLRAKAKVDLERAYGDLENQVSLRTDDLRQANRQLLLEVGERTKAEAALKATFDELVQAGKMVALGQIAAGITHELNQPLAALRTLSDNARVLLDRGRDADARDNLSEISQLVARMGRITGELKGFARKAPARLEPVDLRQVIADSLSLLRSRLRQERIEVQLHIPEPAPFGIGDPNRLQQVLVNLLTNAIDAMADSQRRELTISLHRHGDADDADGGTVRLTVADSGGGLTADVQSHLFEPFFTTKPVGVGLGLGLPISVDIVKACGGSLEGRNTSSGAAFTIELLSAKATHTYA
ncbi:MAG: dctB [Rhizobacter sp.]|nr:dctB [Rhizobacter sp.]